MASVDLLVDTKSLFSGDGNIAYGRLFMIFSLIFIIYIVGNVIYSLKFHPLAGYPGPAWAACSRIPWWAHAISGNQISWMSKLHKKYGSVVRFSPNDLSYVDHGGDAWKAVHSHARGSQEFPKAKEWFVNTSNGLTAEHPGTGEQSADVQ